MVLLDASDHNDVIEVFSMAITKLCPFAVELPVHYFRTITPIVTYLRQGYMHRRWHFTKSPKKHKSQFLPLLQVNSNSLVKRKTFFIYLEIFFAMKIVCRRFFCLFNFVQLFLWIFSCAKNPQHNPISLLRQADFVFFDWAWKYSI